MGNPSFGKGWHARGAHERPRTQAKVEQAFKAGQRSSGLWGVAGSAAGGVILFLGNVAYDQWKLKRAAKQNRPGADTA